MSDKRVSCKPEDLCDALFYAPGGKFAKYVACS